MVKLRRFLLEEKRTHTVYPPGKDVFFARNSTPFEQDRVVILGQAPYHGDNQAHELCFSVRRGFWGCGHISTINDRLVARGPAPIQWELPK
ncbi:MAG: hypothetical protein KC502_03325 [Myxococcales bacterium]|nr:hypothetical protein [Myxococcales bacterium]